jgi:hydrogenase-1 operon protein HyaF
MNLGALAATAFEPQGAAADPGAASLSPLAAAVLCEVIDLLGRLDGDASFHQAIDLHALPLTAHDVAALRAHLGDGEVDAAVDAAGRSRVVETAYAGVWWLDHGPAAGGADGARAQIVVARVPDLLLAHPADIAAARARLHTQRAALERGVALGPDEEGNPA